jgi:hypothetical protein
MITAKIKKSMFIMCCTILFISCKKDKNNANTCLQNTTDATLLEAAYLATPSVANCTAWENALQKSLNSCDGVLTATELQEIRDQLDDIQLNGCN